MLEILLSPVFIAFGVILIGYYIGKIKVYGISLDLSAILIISIVIGFVISMKSSCNADEIQKSMSVFSSLGTALFIPVVGIISGYSLKLKETTDIKSLMVGALMSLVSFLSMKSILHLDKTISESSVLGALCGALTSTPGLSASCEFHNYNRTQLISGYGCTYLFGVVFTVLVVQILSGKTTLNNSHKTMPLRRKQNLSLGGLMLICISVVLGLPLGSLRFFGVSLGNTGGMLCAGIAVGKTLKYLMHNRDIKLEEFNLYRSLGLVLFFVGNGIPAGMQLNNGFEARIFLYGVVMTFLPILFCIIAFFLLFRNNNASITSILSGGMTSTPAIGVLLQKKKEVSLSQYSATYIGGLITIIFLIRYFT